MLQSASVLQVPNVFTLISKEVLQCPLLIWTHRSASLCLFHSVWIGCNRTHGSQWSCRAQHRGFWTPLWAQGQWMEQPRAKIGQVLFVVLIPGLVLVTGVENSVWSTSSYTHSPLPIPNPNDVCAFKKDASPWLMFKSLFHVKKWRVPTHLYICLPDLWPIGGVILFWQNLFFYSFRGSWMWLGVLQ